MEQLFDAIVEGGAGRSFLIHLSPSTYHGPSGSMQVFRITAKCSGADAFTTDEQVAITKTFAGYSAEKLAEVREAAKPSEGPGWTWLGIGANACECWLDVVSVDDAVALREQLIDLLSLKPTSTRKGR